MVVLHLIYIREIIFQISFPCLKLKPAFVNAKNIWDICNKHKRVAWICMKGQIDP